MGLIEKLRAEFVDIIEWVDDSRHTLVWRFPRYHNQIKHGAQLIVRPGQAAVFVHQGKLADVFGPGTHRLATQNLPVLSTIAGWLHGFESPFKAECYFVRTTQVPDLKWGTPNPVLMRDIDFGPIRLRAFGTYTLRARDPRTLLQELVGTDGSFEADEISELLRAIVHSAFAELLSTSEIAVLDLAQNYAALSEQLRLKVLERVDDEYGLDIPQLYIVNISLPPEVEKALDAHTSISALGDLARYQAYQLGQSIPIAAQNPAGGLAGAGVGLGMGLAVSQQFATPAALPPAAAPHAPPPAAAPHAPPPPPAPLWHIAQDGRTSGPHPYADLLAAARSGSLRPDTLVWSTGMTHWLPAGQLPALAGLFSPAPPPLPGS